MAGSFPESATLKWRKKKTWDNFHRTLEQPIQGIYTPHYPPGNPPTSAGVINSCTQDIQQAIRVAKWKNVRLRAAGSGWSFSGAGVADGIILDTSRLKGWIKITEGNLDPAYPGDADARPGLFMFQCGTLIAEINKLIESDAYGRSMRTTGAANGQTIVGATATGTHGSVLGFGAIHDQIVAIHLLASDTRQVWLERSSYPVTKPALAAALGAEMIRNDHLFNAVVMSFGSFGVIHNVVLETRPRFLLQAETKMPIPFDDDLRNVIATLDVTKHPALKDGGEPYFLQIVVDPHSRQGMINCMYEQPWRSGHRPNYGLKEGKIGPGYDSLGIIGKILDGNRRLIPGFFQLVSTLVDTSTKPPCSWGETFGYKAPSTDQGSSSVAVALEDAVRTLDILIQLNEDIGPVPLLFGCRFVARSPALLAFNRFEPTMVVSIDGLYNRQSKRFFRMAPERLEDAGILYTQHWGKVNVSNSQRIRAAYGHDRVDAWLTARHHLLPDAADRFVFSNAYMEACGLSD